jgi:hypothetical protein
LIADLFYCRVQVLFGRNLAVCSILTDHLLGIPSTEKPGSQNRGRVYGAITS